MSPAAHEFAYDVGPRLTESGVWLRDVAPLLEGITPAARAMWHYGFTEMFNNAIEHAGASRIEVTVTRDEGSTQITIADNGVGVFAKVQQALDLFDPRHAVVELAKGKFTTDPERHSGEGIFFTSRAFDAFEILSGGVRFSHRSGEPDVWDAVDHPATQGSRVTMRLNDDTERALKSVFDAFTTEGDDGYAFAKTVVPVRLMEYGDDQLVSRSQARRMLVGFDRFRMVILDFDGVVTIGQAFADEVFRVFRSRHAGVDVFATGMAVEVRSMVIRAST